MEDSPQERQNNEIEALKAIFAEDLVDNRQAIAWKVWRPIDVNLTLRPLHNSMVAGTHCSVILHIKCCSNYPHKRPSISFDKLQGISHENGAKLLEELDTLASQLCGEVMIFELAQHVQNFLHKHNRPTLSFYDEMLERQNEMERLKMHDLQLKESNERKKIKEEIQQRQEILKNEGKQRTHRSNLGFDSTNEEGHDPPELVYYADNKASNVKKKIRERATEQPCTCNFKGIQILRISQRSNRKVHIGKCLGHSSNGSTTNLAIDAETGDFLITKKWCLTPSTDFQMRNKQLNSIDQDLKIMCRIKHPILVTYNSMELQQEVTPKKTSVQNVYVFRDFILGSSLKYLRTKLCGIGNNLEALRFVRHVGNGVLNGLVELHNAGLVHRDVRSENVFLDDKGSVKLVGASLDMRFQEIVENGSYCDKQTKAQDIFSAAHLLMSLVANNKTGLEIPSYLPSAAKDFFSRCLTEDENLQWTAEQLVKHSFLTDAPAPLLGNREADDGYSGSEEDDKALAQTLVHSCLQTGGHSRLSAEFEVLKWLGKGAFGDVLKVKNKLDGGFYAIKRIKLNPENVQLKKKITREVKLLSRLNHENVVRYYNAWIETMQPTSIEDSMEPSDHTEKGVNKTPQKTPERKAKVANSMETDVAKLAPGVKVEWSMSDGQAQKVDDSSESDSSDSNDTDDEDDAWFKMLPTTAELDDTGLSIEFQMDTANQSETLPSEQTADNSRPLSEHIHQVLYIQMEFCEKNTLRHAIDNGLYLDTFKAWQLFREIVEGLAHVHQRGMIHRDLKPVNIFLDSNDHVKIGDFGLATKVFTGLLGPVDDKTKAQEELGGSLTGQVGTALYVAPELLQDANKVIYNQKVDIYSLGIILFEIFHVPLKTGMERMKVLTELRSKDVHLPEDFIKEENNKQIHVIRWLLNHDPSLRPTCAELLSCEHVPRAVPEGALAGLVAHALSERGGRSHRRLVSACMERQATPAEDYTYQQGLKGRPDAVLAKIRDAVVEVFKVHAATEFAPPLLLPRVRAWNEITHAVKMMTAFGSVVHLPHNLRLPFARHTAYSKVKYTRRYIVDKVFRESRQASGLHPKEILECAFDIVTPKTTSLWSDAELLVVASAASARVQLKITVQLNHTTILTGMLVACGVPMDRHADFYPVLVNHRMDRMSNLQLQTHLTSLCLNIRDTSNLVKLMECNVPVEELKTLLTPLMKRSEWCKSVKEAITELEIFVRNAKALGADCPISVAPCLAHNVTQYSGIFWQMLRDRGLSRQGKQHKSCDVLVVGGRYNTLVEEYWKIARSVKEESELNSCSVGLSMSLERMAAIVKKRDINFHGHVPPKANPPTICVCIWGAAGSGRECVMASRRATLARDLWAAGCPTCLADCRGTGEAHELTGARLVALLADDSGASVRLAHWDNSSSVKEQLQPLGYVVDYIKQRFPPANRIAESSNSGRTSSWSESEKCSNLAISATVITQERLSSNTRRRFETQAIGAATACQAALGVSRRTCVLALSCDAACVRQLAANIDAPIVPADLQRSFRPVCDAFPRQRKLLSEALDVLAGLVSAKSSADEPTLYALYSIPDALCRLIT